MRVLLARSASEENSTARGALALSGRRVQMSRFLQLAVLWLLPYLGPNESALRRPSDWEDWFDSLMKQYTTAAMKWATLDHPLEMLGLIYDRVSERKLRLFACACCRRIERLFPDNCLLQGVEVVEQAVDGHGQIEDLDAVSASVESVYRATCEPYDPNRYSAAAAAVSSLVRWQPLQNDYGACQPETRTVGLAGEAIRRAEISDRKAESREHQAQCELLRDIVGNPYRPMTLDPDWLTWNSGTVVKVAQGIYDERAFDRLSILADALEDAGCDATEILAHCRGPGSHVRGCWVIDLILAKDR